MKSVVMKPTILHKFQVKESLRAKESARNVRSQVGMKPVKTIRQKILTVDRHQGTENLESIQLKVRPNSAQSTVKSIGASQQ